MVFQKLTDEQKQKLFDLKEELGKDAVSSMRALIMRGASVEEAKKTVEERAKARNEYIDQMEKELQLQTETEAKPKKKTKTKKEVVVAIEDKPLEPVVEEAVKEKKPRGKKRQPDEPTITIV